MSKTPKTFQGKPMRLGGGGRFAKLKAALMAEGNSANAAENIAAKIGRKKYGKKKFQSLAAKGRKRAKG